MKYLKNSLSLFNTGQIYINETFPDDFRAKFGAFMQSGAPIGVILDSIVGRFVTPMNRINEHQNLCKPVKKRKKRLFDYFRYDIAISSNLNAFSILSIYECSYTIRLTIESFCIIDCLFRKTVLIRI